MDVCFNLVNLVNPVQETTMRRLKTKDYAVDAVAGYPPSEASAEGGSMRGAKALLGAWLCRRLDGGAVMRRRITAHRHSLRLPARPAPQMADYRRGTVVAKNNAKML